MSLFKKTFSIEHRKKESQKMLTKYVDRIPIIVEKSSKCKLKVVSKNKFLVPHGLTLAQFLVILRKRIELNPSETLFLFINDSILAPTSNSIISLYEEYKDEDNFLYLSYCNENVFGNKIENNLNKK